MKKRPEAPNDIARGEIILFQTYDGRAKIQVRFEENSVWLTQKTMAKLYQISVKTVNEHLKHIFNEGELDENSVIRRNRITAADGKTYDTNFYRLEAILAVGYRVRSQRGTQFRQWATNQLEEFLRKGFVMDDERLKAGKNVGDDYFGELISRIRDIRNSERRFYQKVTDIYATSLDYNSASPTTQEFYATVQNKLHWAIHGQTAAEVIVSRADASKKNMGLTSWKNSPDGPIRKSDVSIAKKTIFLKRNSLRSIVSYPCTLTMPRIKLQIESPCTWSIGRKNSMDSCSSMKRTFLCRPEKYRIRWLKSIRRKSLQNMKNSSVL
jgi:hypothetical protein